MTSHKNSTYLIIQAFLVLLMLTISGCQKEIIELTPSNGAEQDAGNKKSGKVNLATGTIFGTSGIVFGTYRYSIPLTAENYVTIKVNVTTTGSYNITSNTFNGYNFSKSGIFTNTGIQTIALIAKGTPIAPSINTFIFTFGTSCVFKVVVVYKNPIVQTSCNVTETYYEVANHKTLKVWLDRNLGASQPAVSSTDFLSYGSFFQWGRLADNHQCISWSGPASGLPNNETINTTSPTNNPGHSLFITAMSNPYDWRVPQNPSLWQGVNGLNNPCPGGFRLPTLIELTSERLSWENQNAAGAFSSQLKWTLPGYRDFDGEIYEPGGAAGYWSSTVAGSESSVMWIEPTGAFSLNENRAVGYSVRCIKN